MEENNDGDGDGDDDDDDEWWNWKEGGRERRLEQQLQLILLTVVVPHSSDGYGLWTNETPVRGEGLALLLYDATHLTAKPLFLHSLSSLVCMNQHNLVIHPDLSYFGPSSTLFYKNKDIVESLFFTQCRVGDGFILTFRLPNLSSMYTYIYAHFYLFQNKSYN